MYKSFSFMLKLWHYSDMYNEDLTVEPRYNEDLGTMKITLL